MAFTKAYAQLSLANYWSLQGANAAIYINCKTALVISVCYSDEKASTRI